MNLAIPNLGPLAGAGPQTRGRRLSRSVPEAGSNRAELAPMQPSAEERRKAMWAYYDRRIAHREPGPETVLKYFRGLGVDADLGDINSELREIEQRLAQLPATTFIDVGAGPSGTFTLQVPGLGIALDQSDGALRQLRSVAPRITVARGDALHLPVRSKAVGRMFVSHLYGLLLPDERGARSPQRC